MINSERRCVYKALFIIVFAVTLGFSIVNPFFSIYVKDLGAQGLLIGLVSSGYFLAKTVFTPLVGHWSDSKGRRRYIIGGLGIYAVVSLCYCYLPETLLFLLFLRFMQGVGAALVRPLVLAYIGDISKKSCEGACMGTFDVSFYSALAVGPLLGGIINDWLGYYGIFQAMLLLSCFALSVALLTISEERPTYERKVKRPYDYGEILGDPALQGLLCFIFTRSLGIVLMSVFLPIFIYTHRSASSLEIGVIIASGSFLTPFLLRPLGILSDRSDRRSLVIVGGMLSGIFIFLIPLAGGFAQLVFLSIGLAFFSTLSLPASSAILVQEGNHYGMGSTIGLFHFVMNIGFLIGPLLGGILMDTIGLRSVFFAAGTLGILGSLFFCLLSAPNLLGQFLVIKKV